VGALEGRVAQSEMEIRKLKIENGKEKDLTRRSQRRSSRD
jgi:hypothetical protein